MNTVQEEKLYKIQIKNSAYCWSNHRNRPLEDANLAKNLFFCGKERYNAAKAQGCAKSSRGGAEHLVHFFETIALMD